MPVFIQSKIPPRQSGAKYPGEQCPSGLRVDVTSGQVEDNAIRIAFSPLTAIPDGDGPDNQDGYRGFYCFENFWQSGKRFKELDHLDKGKKKMDITTWKGYTTQYHRHPKSKGMVPVDAVYPDIGQTVPL
jgi:hypothetical protein